MANRNFINLNCLDVIQLRRVAQIIFWSGAPSRNLFQSGAPLWKIMEAVSVWNSGE